LDHDGVPLPEDRLNDFHSEIRDGLGKRVPNDVNAATNWDNAIAAVGGVSPLGAFRTESDHAFDIMSIIGGEELLGSRRDLCRIRFHPSS
jgi:hypothetical protein